MGSDSSSNWKCPRCVDDPENEEEPKGDTGKSIKCQFCSYTTYSRQHLNRHLAGAHKNDNKKFFCRLCSFSCASMDNLRKHILKTTKHPGSNVYQCHLCTFKNNS